MFICSETNHRNDCIFCNFPLEEFIKCTNICHAMKKIELAKNNEVCTLRMQQNIRNFYVRYLTKQLSEEEQQGIVMSLQKVQLLIKYQNVCEKCKEYYQIMDDGLEMPQIPQK